MRQHTFRPTDALAEFAHQVRAGTVHIVNSDPVVVRIGNIGAAARIEIDIVRTTLVVRPEFRLQLKRFRIEYRNTVVVDVGDKEILPVGREFQIVRISQRCPAGGNIGYPQRARGRLSEAG
jgi:hypothetical protein